MRILDRYCLKNFVVPWFYCLTAFLFLFVIIDLFNRLDNFVDAEIPPLRIAYFYGRFLTTQWVLVAPITVLLGMLYALYKLTRSNQIVAMRASGISLYRVLVPFFVFGILISIFTAWINDTFAPGNEGWTRNYIQKIKQRDQTGPALIRNLRYRNPEGYRTWEIRQIDKNTFEMRGVSIRQMQANETGNIKEIIQAESAVWLDGQWRFNEVTIFPHNEDGVPLPDIRVQRFPIRLMRNLTESPEKILRETKDFAWLTRKELKEYLATRSSISDRARADIETQIHVRLAQPWMCLVVTLLAVPFGTQTARKGSFKGILICMGLFFSFYITVNFGKALGQGQYIAPFWGGWAPILLYVILGAVMVHRLR